MATVSEAFAEKVDNFVSECVNAYSPTKVRDDKVIRDTIHGHHLFYRHEINVLDSPLLQRLRRIHQNAFASLVYPAATHTRFEHSLGVSVLVQRMIDAINRKPRTPLLDDVQKAELRLAALLHDCGHGPFSHASEMVYDEWDSTEEIENLRREQPEIFGAAQGHEILSYHIVLSKAFGQLWSQIVDLYDADRDPLICRLERISLERVANMILGIKAGAYPLWISNLINGPVDADKLDYIRRDGYFSGLATPVDVDRLFVSLGVHSCAQHQQPFLYVDFGGATVLEQIMFGKMILFSSVYDHHKVRSGFRLVAALLQEAREKKAELSGTKLESAIDFLRVDDYDLLSGEMKDRSLQRMVENIKNRILPKRALVITKDAISGSSSEAKYFELEAQPSEIRRGEKDIASEAGCERVFIDFPPTPRFAKMGQQSMVKLSDEQFVPLSRLYPTAGWVAGYSQYRYRAYVLAPPGFEERVGDTALSFFKGKEIILDKALCFSLAKLPGRSG